MNARFRLGILVFCGLLVGFATLARACDRLASAAVFAVPQQAVVLSVVPFAQQAVIVQSNPVVSLSNPCFVPSAAVSVQSFGGGVSASVAGRGFNAAAVGGRRAVIRQGGIRGLFFGNVVRSR